MEQLIEIAQLEHGADLRCGCGDAQITPRLPGDLQARDQRAQT